MSGFEFPDSERLSNGLTSALRDRVDHGKVTVLERKSNPYNSTFPTEIVTCRDDAKGIFKLFIKYGVGRVDSVFGHRGGLSYEARVYREILRPLHTTTPTLYGVYRDQVTGVNWLILEYLSGGHRASWTRDPNAMISSARWAGEFHALNESRIDDQGFRFLHRYDHDYYAGWSRRTRKFFKNHSGKLQNRFPWVVQVCDAYDDLLSRLLAARPTVIHGECFGSNIVYQNGLSRPIDWQSAAIAPGEIDLASLTLAWPKTFVKKLETVYRNSRWPNGVPEGFRESLNVARLYMSFRWLGDTRLMSQWFKPREHFVIPKDPKRIIAELHDVGQMMGVV